MAILFALIYWPTIRSEEEFLRGRFRNYTEYCRRVPRLLPRLRPAHPQVTSEVTGGFSGALYGKHREYNAALGALSIYAVLLLRLFVWHRAVFLSM